MSLLRRIQDAAISPETDVATLLRMCKVLAVRLGNEDFKNWVDSELNGYPDQESVPDYRRLNVQSVGHFSGPYGSGMQNAPIPPMCIPERFREGVKRSILSEPISYYGSLVAQSDGNNARENWSADLVAFVGSNIFENMNCMAAWKVIPFSALVALIDTIKTRVLNFCLEIESEDPDAGEAPPNEPPIAQERVDQVFNTFITGTVQNLATGSHHVSQQATMNSGVSDALFRDLLQAISTVNDAHAVQEMQLSVESMRDAYGTNGFLERYRAFMGTLADHVQLFGPVVAPYLNGLASLLAP